ncbi:MAG: NAD(P)H-binding protein [Streptosporangiaceae bacterium]|nr:NAD(P)H-binding protein [Streptosporangiaceae bacterium]
MILVTGATGNVGGELVRALAQAGERVRALTRDGASPGLPDGVEQVKGDLNQPDSLRDALTGVRGLFLLPGYQGMAQTLAHAGQAGVERVAMLSGSSAASGDTSNAVSAYMIESETTLKESGLAWTIVRSFGFMSNTLRWIPQLAAGDVVRDAFADVPVAMVDPFDIAAVLAVGLTTDSHQDNKDNKDQVYTVSGPQPLRPADRVRILGEVLGRDLRFEAQSNAEARAEMSAAMPQAYVDAFFSFYVDGTLDESTPLPTVADVTGRPPRAFEQWARAHASAFA